MSKTQGAIGRLYRQVVTDKDGNTVFDEEGNPKTTVRIYFTQDAIIKAKQIAFLDVIEEDYRSLEKANKLSGRTADEILEEIAKNDEMYNRQTLYRVKLGKAPEGEGLVGNAGTSKL